MPIDPQAHMAAIRILAWSLGITPYEAAALLAGIEIKEVED